MSMDLFKKILDEAADLRTITEICITGLGEPTLDRHIVDRIRYARKKKPSTPIDIYTNGVYLTPERFEEMRDAGLSTVNISLNAINADQHERVMGLRGKFELVCSNIDYALSHRKNCQVEVRGVINGDIFTRADAAEFYDRWGDKRDGGHGCLVQEGNWAGDSRTIRKFLSNEACARALRQIYVMFDGRVTTCCFDPTGKTVFGDLTKQTLREVYADPAYLAFRQSHSEDKADQYSLCRDCTRI